MTNLTHEAFRFDPLSKTLYEALGVPQERAQELILDVLRPIAYQTITGRWSRVQTVAELRDAVPNLQEFMLCLQAMQQVLFEIEIAIRVEARQKKSVAA